MSVDTPTTIKIKYDEKSIQGILVNTGDSSSSIWTRLQTFVLSEQIFNRSTNDKIEVSWPDLLRVIREFGSKKFQKSLNFRFQPEGIAAEMIKEFIQQFHASRARSGTLVSKLSKDEIRVRLKEIGFTKRELKDFQLRDIEHLLSLPHGANFSVPGAGKTTVTFALHLLVKSKSEHLFIVCPKAAFPAWSSIVDECMSEDSPNNGTEKFIILDSNEAATDAQLKSGHTRFIMSYDLLIRQQSTVSSYFARQPVHLVLDESHRMKAGLASQRGAFLLNIAPLPVRRDILSGTPMPQGANDLASQLGFLWPGHGFDLQIQRGTSPRDVLGNLYVRTTKQELGLPPAKRHFKQVEMLEGQLAFYGVVRSEALRQLTKIVKSGRGGPDYLSARRSVMRLLQLSVNPTLALQGITNGEYKVSSGIVDKILEETTSLKMQEVVRHTRDLAKDGKKIVIWTIFTNTINELETMLADLNPVSIYGATPSGADSDPVTREGKIKRFHLDKSCSVLIANPAAAGEGISLHTVCHDAIYLDRSYVSTHYLQSIDRIHRLGLAPDIETNIYIYQTKAPPSLGSVDLSVSRRLATKIRNMQQLLDDPDLHSLALDEENADDPIDYDVDLQDLIDLVEELEGRSNADSEEA